MNLKLIKQTLFVFLISLFFSCKSEQKKYLRSPNIIIIYTDDLGYGDVSAYKKGTLNTPNIDKLANESFQFINAYSSSPVCSPTRASIMTGKHPARLNITDWIPGRDPKDKPLLGPKDLNELPLNEITIAEKLKESGYKTFYVGKWHLGSQGFYPENNGFDINIGGFEDIVEKLDNLYQFYKVAMPVNGWQTYSNINLKFNNQIVCVRK